jgi:hypothetical protein
MTGLFGYLLRKLEMSLKNWALGYGLLSPATQRRYHCWLKALESLVVDQFLADFVGGDDKLLGVVSVF